MPGSYSLKPSLLSGSMSHVCRFLWVLYLYDRNLKMQIGWECVGLPWECLWWLSCAPIWPFSLPVRGMGMSCVVIHVKLAVITQSVLYRFSPLTLYTRCHHHCIATPLLPNCPCALCVFERLRWHSRFNLAPICPRTCISWLYPYKFFLYKVPCHLFITSNEFFLTLIEKMIRDCACIQWQWLSAGAMGPTKPKYSSL